MFERIRLALFGGGLAAALAITGLALGADRAIADQPGERASGSGSVGTYQDFSFHATGDQNNTGASGRIKVTYPGTDPNTSYLGDIDCLVVVSGNRAIMSGPITSIQPYPDPNYHPDRFIAVAVDNGPNGGSSSNPDRFGFNAIQSSYYYPPIDCNNPQYFAYEQPIAKGDVDVAP